jgi:hypothetical protein
MPWRITLCTHLQSHLSICAVQRVNTTDLASHGSCEYVVFFGALSDLRGGKVLNCKVPESSDRFARDSGHLFDLPDWLDRVGLCLSHTCCDQRSTEVCVGPGSARYRHSANSVELPLIG